MSATICSIEIGEYDRENRLRATTVWHPTWEQFRDAFAAVRTRERRFAGITVVAADGSSLMLDGSDGLFFALYQGPDGFQFQPLPDPSQSGDVTILCGGVSTTLPRAYLFDEATAFRVVEDFWHGRLDASTSWEPL